MKPNMCRAGTRKGKIKLKKRLLSILLAAVMVLTMLPLGLVDTAWAAETQDAQRKAVTERVQAYIAACNNFSAQNGQSIPYWTISDAEFEGYVQTKTRDKAAETSKLKKQVDAGDFMSALTTKTCTGSNGSHQWSKEKYTCRSHYFSGLDNRGEGYSQCQGFANYMAYVLFGEAGTSESNFTKMTQVGYGFDFQPGDVLRVIDGDKNGHSMVVYAGSGSSAKVIECNWGHSSRGYCNVRWDLTVAQKQKQFPTVETVWRPNASLAVTSGGTDSGGGTTGDVIGSGNCGANGANVTWKLTSDGTLTISGKGKMYDYMYWYSLRSQVKSVIIEDGVTTVGDCAFDCWDALTSVTLPDSVTTIGNQAFDDCTSLTSITIPSSVTSIENYAFGGCVSLTSVTIPSSVTKIGNYAFAGSDAAVNVASGNKNYSSENGVLYNKQKTVLLYGGPCKGTFKIPNGVTSIDEGAFESCERLVGITIPKSVTHIGQYAFAGCWRLRDITLPSSMTEIEEGVFSDCESLASITIPKSVTNIVGYAFYACDNLTDVYYTGTAADWAKITIKGGNEPLTSATLHCAKSAPAAPVVKIGNSASSGKPMLTWNAVEGATSYRIYRSTSKGSGYSLLGTTTATSYTNTGAKEGVTYYYRVKACNGAGLSPYSNVVSGKVKSVTPKPSAPVVKIGNSATSGKPMLTWKAVSGATSYKVYRATSQKGTYSLLGTVTATSYTNTGAKAGVTYWYKVKAVNSAGEGAFSNVVSGRATVTTLTMGHSATSGKPQLTWKAVSGAASYRVYRATAKNGAYSVINTTKALTYTNTGAALGTTYYYKVEALNAAGKSLGFSAIVEGKVAPVLAVGYSSVSGKPQLTWKAVPGATEYQVYRSTQQNSGYSKINTTTSTSYVNTGAKAGTTYYYRIVAVKGTAVSDFSNIVSARPGK